MNKRKNNTSPLSEISALIFIIALIILGATWSSWAPKLAEMVGFIPPP
jgi:hypothetical protein